MERLLKFSFVAIALGVFMYFLECTTERIRDAVFAYTLYAIFIFALKKLK